LTPDNPYVEFYLERGLESQVMIVLHLIFLFL